MPEKKDFFSFTPKESAEKALPVKSGLERPSTSKSETRLITRPVGTLSPSELLELKQWLDRSKINIRQPLLQTGKVSAGYAKYGAIELGDGRIAFVPNQNNERIVGTPQEFLEALKILDGI